MTTRGVPSPTSIHFTIDGRHGILEARDIAEALQIPFEPVIHLLSASGPQYLRGTWSAFYPGDLYRFDPSTKELPPGMLLVDVVLRSNLFPYSIQYRGDELFGCFIPYIRGLLLWPTPLDHGLLVHFEEKVHRKKLQRADTIPLLFRGCFARSWSIWVSY
ncbi:hypothetical protein CK203_033863 [Vitis vinifera]|uniref:Uncharacterized protein n=1 Tax=Vitis vinifera TaxID=29760 RepID=A0A438IQI3_VITVI|nr:hypothetical protein CK203_033863 [Vitis vinifera]